MAPQIAGQLPLQGSYRAASGQEIGRAGIVQAAAPATASSAV